MCQLRLRATDWGADSSDNDDQVSVRRCFDIDGCDKGRARRGVAVADEEAECPTAIGYTINGSRRVCSVLQIT